MATAAAAAAALLLLLLQVSSGSSSSPSSSSSSSSSASVQLKISPSSTELAGTQLFLLCHSTDPDTRLHSVTVSLRNGRASARLSATGGLQLRGAWTSRSDISGTMSKSVGVVHLRARSQDSGIVVCAADFANSSSSSSVPSQPQQLIVGQPPEPPSLEIIAAGGKEWIADKSSFTIRCTARTSFPAASISVSVSGVAVVGSLRTHEDRVVFTRVVTASPMLNGRTVLCASANVFGLQRVQQLLDVRYVSNVIVVSESVHEEDNERMEVTIPHSHFVACNGASNPEPKVNWSVPVTAKGGLKQRNNLLEITQQCPLGMHKVTCQLQLPTGETLTKSLQLHVAQSKEVSFAPNVVAILVGVCLAVSVLLNGIFCTLLCKIYKSDEAWNFQHEYTHIPIRKWVTKSMT